MPSSPGRLTPLLPPVRPDQLIYKIAAKVTAANTSAPSPPAVFHSSSHTLIYCHKSCLPTRIQAPRGQRVLSVCPTAPPGKEDQMQNCWWNKRGSHLWSPRPPALCSPTLFSTSLNLGTRTGTRRETCKAPKSRSLPPPPSLQGFCLQQGPHYRLRPYPASPRHLTAGLRAQGKDDQRVETLWGGRRKKGESDLTPVC